MRWRSVIVVCLLVSMAGCSGLFGYGHNTSTTSQMHTATTRTTSTTTRTTSAPPQATGTTARQTTSAGTYGSDFPTRRVLFTLPELNGSYRLQGDTRVVRSNASNQERRRLDALHTRVVEEQAFNETNGPRLILGTVIVFNTSTNATSWLHSHLAQISQHNGSVSSVSLGDGVSSQEAKFNSQGGLRTVALYGKRKNVVFYVAVADTSASSTTARRLFEEMVADLPSSASSG